MSNIFLDFSIPKILEKIEKGELVYSDLAATTIKSINQHEDSTLAWETYDLEKTKSELEKFDFQGKAINNKLKLPGIPFGVKDVFNTKGFTTEMGSPIWKGFTPGNNARVVDSLLEEGCIIVGKTVTAEFAVHGLNQTLNPHNCLHTPGTSSSGSAASISRGMVPFALATQTGGSITRPASFCGVWGMKPSFGMIARTGSLKTTDSLDSIGFLTSHGENLRLILDSTRVSGPNYPYVFKNVDSCGPYPKNIERPWKIGFVKTHVWENAKKYAQKEILSLVNKISLDGNYNVEEITWPDEFFEVHNNHATIYNKSLSYYFKNEKESNKNSSITPLMMDMIIKGEAISLEEYCDALKYQEDFCCKLDHLFLEYDIIISLATAGSAPLRSEISQDDPSLIWTFGHLPSITAPQFRSPEGLPFGVQFTSRKWNDYLLLQGIEKLINKGIISKGSQKIL